MTPQDVIGITSETTLLRDFLRSIPSGLMPSVTAESVEYNPLILVAVGFEVEAADAELSAT